MDVQWRKLEPQEAEKFLKKQGGGERAAISSAYRENLKGYEVGDWVEIMIPEGAKKITVKNRLMAAARELGVELSFRRTTDERVLFQIAKQGTMDLEDDNKLVRAGGGYAIPENTK